MRTVTFSDPAVAKAVGDGCVATWVNRVPKFHNCEFVTEERILQETPDCFPTKNFCTYFCTSDQKVLHYFTGYYAPATFLGELAFARALLEKAVDASGDLKTNLFKTMHGERVEERQTEWKSLVKAEGDNAWRRRQGLTYLEKVDAALKGQGPSPLDAAIKDHLSGNSFTEERSSSSRRR